jgi:hypothetical protein
MRRLPGSLFLLPTVIVLGGSQWELDRRIPVAAALVLPHWALGPVVWGAFGALFGLRRHALAARTLAGWQRCDLWVSGILIYAVLFHLPSGAAAPAAAVVLAVLLSILWAVKTWPYVALTAVATASVAALTAPRIVAQIAHSRLAQTYEVTVDHRLKPSPEKSINEDGIRFKGTAREMDEADFNMLFLGDSFTYGVGVDYGDTYPYHFEKVINGYQCSQRIRVVNLGWASASPLLGLRLLRELGYRYKPDHVVYNLDMTDFHDDLRYELALAGDRALHVDPLRVLVGRWAPGPGESGTARWLGHARGLWRGRGDPLPAGTILPRQRFFATNQPLEASRPDIERGVVRNLRQMHAFARDVLSTLARNFGDVFLHAGSGGQAPRRARELRQEYGQVATGEGPLEWGGRLLVVGLKPEEPILDGGQAGEVIGREDLALDDREVDLDLVEPTRVDRGVHQREPGPLGLQPCLRSDATMRGAIVHDPEHSRGRAIGFLAHDLRHQAAEGRDACRALTPPEHLGPVHIPDREVGPGATARVLMLDPHRTARRGGLRRVATHARLNARLLVRAEDVLSAAQGPALPAAGVQIQNQPRLGREGRVPREEPASIPPGPNSILTQPAPNRGAADLGHQTLGQNRPAQRGPRPTGQRHPAPAGQLTRQRLDGDDDAGGKSGLGARLGAARRAPGGATGRSACATC